MSTSAQQSDDEDWECPLCMEEMDLSDRNFKPCPCGYQICQFCWNHIKENLNGRCPACRREYTEQTVQFTPLTPNEVQRLKNEKKRKEKEKREMELNNRRHLANLRVVQKNLVYVIGLSAKIASEEILKQHEYFGQYGKILKIVVNRKNMGGYNQVAHEQNASLEPTVGIYVTFARKEDAARCIQTIEGTVYEGRVLRASYGTTKYCSYYLRGLTCQNPGCMYLHEPGEEADSYTKEEMSMGKHHAKTNPHIMQSSAGSAASGPLNLTNAATLVNENGEAVGPAAPFGANAPEKPATFDQGASTPKTPWKHAAPGLAHPPAQVMDDGPQHTNVNVPQVVAGSMTGAGLPKTAPWAKQGGTSTGANTPTLQGKERPREEEYPFIECVVLEEVRMAGSKHAVSMQHKPVINTANLHRYLFLAQEAREYFLQQRLAVQASHGFAAPTAGVSPSVQFAFDPFRDDSKQQNQEKSRFGFAQQGQNMPAQPSDLLGALSQQFQQKAALQGGLDQQLNFPEMSQQQASQFGLAPNRSNDMWRDNPQPSFTDQQEHLKKLIMAENIDSRKMDMNRNPGSLMYASQQQPVLDGLSSDLSDLSSKAASFSSSLTALNRQVEVATEFMSFQSASDNDVTPKFESTLETNHATIHEADSESIQPKKLDEQKIKINDPEELKRATLLLRQLLQPVNAQGPCPLEEEHSSCNENESHSGNQVEINQDGSVPMRDDGNEKPCDAHADENESNVNGNIHQSSLRETEDQSDACIEVTEMNNSSTNEKNLVFGVSRRSKNTHTSKAEQKLFRRIMGKTASNAPESKKALLPKTEVEESIVLVSDEIKETPDLMPTSAAIEDAIEHTGRDLDVKQEANLEKDTVQLMKKLDETSNASFAAMDTCRRVASEIEDKYLNQHYIGAEQNKRGNSFKELLRQELRSRTKVLDDDDVEIGEDDDIVVANQQAFEKMLENFEAFYNNSDDAPDVDADTTVGSGTECLASVVSQRQKTDMTQALLARLQPSLFIIAVPCKSKVSEDLQKEWEQAKFEENIWDSCLEDLMTKTKSWVF